MLQIDHLPHLYLSWRQRHQGRDERMAVMSAVVRGDFDIFDPDEERIDSRSPNLIQVALEDTAEAASLVPTIRVQPSGRSQEAKQKANRMEKVGVAILQANDVDTLILRSLMDVVGYGMTVWTVTPDMDQRIPLIERRDPTYCYPEPGFRPGDKARRVMFARQVYFTQLPEAYQTKLAAFIDSDTRSLGLAADENQEVTVVEYYDDEEIVVAAMFATSSYGTYAQQNVDYIPVELERIEHKLGICPVVIGARITFDGEIRGQFDQVVGILEAHIRLMGMVLDYADQAVYSDIWVRDLIGEMPYGGGGYIELGPQGGIGRVPPAVSSLDVQRDIERLVEGIHLGGRWPKQRPGDVDQAIASAKFVEATAGVMNTAIRTYHQIMQRMIQRALRIAFIVDRNHFPGPKRAAGVLRNQEFLLEYDARRDIDLDAPVRVEYGLGLGRDPAQSAVLHIQYSQNEFVSKEFVQENIDGLTDVGRERVRIDLEKFEAMAMAKLLQGVQQGTIPDRALIEMAKARQDGDSLFDVYEKYVVKPQEEIQQQMVPNGMGGMVPPGPPGQQPPGGQQQGPQAPTPAPPQGSDLLARLGVPAGPGGTLGAQTVQKGGSQQ